MNKRLRMKDRQGNLLIESIVSISVVLIGFLGVFGLLSRSLSINKDIGQKFVATYLAAEGIEVVKSLIDTSFVGELAWNDCCGEGVWEAAYDSTTLVPAPVQPTPLLFDETDGSYNYESGSQSPFVRTIEISEFDRNEDGQSDEIKVNSKVSWSRRGEVLEINLEDHFFDWRQ
ncbi:hypothetical protein A2116_00660 [Candidatus Jorgensenbacteria bacterium GWA1_49_17]|uniref:Type II secretion system protein n=2 Tax=Candidatus Joergenseniibacteriota TaxID=1752739 RepID=A0A1F6BS26_9BACT|nr:MAG: hypothetical protein A2127_02180 [Candidatus Jorgensenbacteria bacterium GWC1_48_12]OGG40871.1 MAG: hypothetical protein A2116_00660 [Candidatus Jorgensenbacteria bacterium GWA1_49_17]